YSCGRMHLAERRRTSPDVREHVWENEWHSRGHGFDPRQLHQTQQQVSEMSPAARGRCVYHVSILAGRAGLRRIEYQSPTPTAKEEAPLPRPRQKSVARNVQAIRRSLVSIARSFATLIRLLDSAGRTSSGRGRRGRKLRLSPARRASLKLGTQAGA